MSRVTVTVNGLSLVHEDSGGVSTATLPDVCLTPPTLAPTPYPNVARSRDLVSGSSLVRADGGNRIATAGSAFARSTGGEPGSAGGVSSGTSGAEATFLSHSFDVAIEGRGACRLTDKMLHNRGNTVDCSGVQQHQPKITLLEKKGDPQGAAAHASDVTLPGGKANTRKGLDTNQATINTDFIKGRHFHFVGRYLKAYENGSSDNEKALDPNTGKMVILHPGLTRHEAGTLHTAQLKRFAIWEKTKFWALSDVGNDARLADAKGTLDRQWQKGVGDGHKAREQMHAVGAPKDKPIYFTADFVTTWSFLRRRVESGGKVRFRDLLFKYYAGINSVIGVERTGAYGSYVTIKALFDKGLISYGWQMWYPASATDPTRGKRDHRAQLVQFNITYVPKDGEDWGVAGPGALDFDRALKDDFGQW